MYREMGLSILEFAQLGVKEDWTKYQTYWETDLDRSNELENAL